MVVLGYAALGGPQPDYSVARLLNPAQRAFHGAVFVAGVVNQDEPTCAHQLCRKAELGPHVFLGMQRVEEDGVIPLLGGDGILQTMNRVDVARLYAATA